MPEAKSFIGTDMTAVTTYLYIDDAAQAVAFYEKVMGAKTRFKMDGPKGEILHAEIVVNGSVFMLGEANPEMGMKSPKTIGGTASGIFVYVPDVDRTFKDALAAGATQVRPLEDMFWGDRTACVLDPFGHCWTFATHKEDMSDQEMAKRAEEWTKQNIG